MVSDFNFIETYIFLILFQELLKPLLSDKEQAQPNDDKPCPAKAHIAEELEADAKAPRAKRFELPSGQILFLTYLLDKYGDDYEVR